MDKEGTTTSIEGGWECSYLWKIKRSVESVGSLWWGGQGEGNTRLSACVWERESVCVCVCVCVCVFVSLWLCHRFSLLYVYCDCGARASCLWSRVQKSPARIRLGRIRVSMASFSVGHTHTHKYLTPSFFSLLSFLWIHHRHRSGLNSARSRISTTDSNTGLWHASPARHRTPPPSPTTNPVIDPLVRPSVPPFPPLH